MDKLLIFLEITLDYLIGIVAQSLFDFLRAIGIS